jgi:hypothetical protein
MSASEGQLCLWIFIRIFVFIELFLALNLRIKKHMATLKFQQRWPKNKGRKLLKIFWKGGKRCYLCEGEDIEQNRPKTFQMCRLFSKGAKTIFVLRTNQLSPLNFPCVLADFYGAWKSLKMDLVHLQINFFPPNFFVFWKREFWREKNLLCKKVIRLKITKEL